MKPKGIVDFSIEEEEVFIQFNGSKSAFKTFTSLLLKPLFKEEIKPNFKIKLKKALYFDEKLSDKELIKLTSIK